MDERAWAVTTRGSPARSSERADVSRLARGGALNFLGAAASASSNLLLTVAVTRTLSTSSAGVFFTATATFVLLVGVGRLGSGIGLVFFVSQLRATGRLDQIGRCLRLALGPVLVFTTIMAVVLLVWAESLADLIVAGPSSETATFLRILAPFLPLAALLEGVLGATRGFGIMGATAWIDKTLRPLLQLLAVLVAATIGAGAVVLAWSLPFLPALLIGSSWLRKLHVRDASSADRRSTSTAPDEDGLVGRYWRFTLPRALSSVVQVGLQRLDVILVASILGAGASAVYVVATRLLVVGALGIQAVSMAVQPQVAAHYARGELQAVNDLYRISTTWLILTTWPLYLAGLLFAPTLLRLFGPAYVSGSTVVVILCFATIFSTACGVVDVILTMAGRTSWILFNVAVALIVNVALNLWWIPAYGVEGAAWAWLVAIVSNNLLPLVQLRVSLGMSPFGRSTALAMVVSLLAYVPVSLLSLAVLGQGFSALACGVAAGSLLFVGSALVLRRQLALAELLVALRSRGRGRMRNQ